MAEHPHKLVSGLCVDVSATGKKVWQFRRRVAKTVTLGLGDYPAHPIAVARERATELNERSNIASTRVEMRIEKAKGDVFGGRASVLVRSLDNFVDQID